MTDVVYITFPHQRQDLTLLSGQWDSITDRLAGRALAA